MRRIEAAETALQPWLKKQKKLSELRYGILPKRRVPWKGAANIPAQLIDGILRRWRPGIASLMLDADPIATMMPESSDDFEHIREAEAYLTTLFTQRMRAEPEAVRLADLYAHRGHAYSREGWDYRARERVRVAPASDLIPEGLEQFLSAAAEQGQDPFAILSQRIVEQYDLGQEDQEMVAEAAGKILQGATHVRLVYREVLRDQPGWTAVDPVDVIAPVDQDPEDADFVAFIHEMSGDQIMRQAAEGMFDAAAARAVSAKLSPGRDIEVSDVFPSDTLRRDIKEFLDRGNVSENAGAAERLRVLEVYAKLDLDGDGILERYVLWLVPKQGKDRQEGGPTVLRAHPYAHPFHNWPVTLYKFSPDAVRPIDSRGISEMLGSFARIANEFLNARLNASQILLSPVFKKRYSALQHGETKVDWRPGGLVEVQDMNDIEPLVQDLRVLAELIREEQVNQRAAETYVGVFDATITSLEASRERRTAAEVNAISNVSASIFGMDARLFQASFSRSLTKIWELFLEWGDTEDFIRRVGKPPQPVRKADIGKKFDIYAAGTPTNTNRAVLLGNAERILQVVLNSGPLLQGNVVDVRELLTYWMRVVDQRLADRVIRSPEEATAVQQVMEAARAGAEATGQEDAEFGVL